MAKIKLKDFAKVIAITNAPAFKTAAKERKSWLRRFAENFYIWLKDKCPYPPYNETGLDRKGMKISDVIRTYRDLCRRVGKPNHNAYIIDWADILNEKFVLQRIFEAYGIPMPKLLAYSTPVMGIWSESKKIDLEELRDIIKAHGSVFMKPTDAFGGEGIERLTPESDLKKVEERIKKGSFVFQEGLKQHPEMSRLNDTSINDIRIVTVKQKDGTYALLKNCVKVRIGRKGSYVDNVHSGGIAVCLDEEGCLLEFAYSRDVNGNLETFISHPDSGLKFRGIKIPFLDKAVELAVKAHEVFHHLPLIGWDVAITPEGPVIIEGNYSPDMEGFSIHYQDPILLPYHVKKGKAVYR